MDGRLTERLAAMRQVGSFALSQPLEGKVAFHISPSPTGGPCSSHNVVVSRKGRRCYLIKPLPSVRKLGSPVLIDDSSEVFSLDVLEVIIERRRRKFHIVNCWDVRM